jgi:hypothetical protein
MNETSEQLERRLGQSSDDPWERRAWGQKDILDLIDLDLLDRDAPEDAAVDALCERFGYGAVMDAAARLWARRDPRGALTVGPCRATVESARALWRE